MNAAVTEHLLTATQWSTELVELRRILLDCGLEEAFKWGKPCYRSVGKNLVLLCGFKAQCGLMFLEGSLIDDPEGRLINSGDPISAIRQLRFTSTVEVLRSERLIKTYVSRAVEAALSGRKVKLLSPDDLKLPAELLARFDASPALRTAFRALTPGRQRDYYRYFVAAKQAKTRISRIDKHAPHIMRGLGLVDCHCGLSEAMPRCDGSHKYLDGNGEDMRQPRIA